MRLFLTQLLVGIGFFSLNSLAQEIKQESQSQQVSEAKDVWVVTIRSCKDPDQEYAVRMGSLQTVTLQGYDMRKEDKIRKVVELTIETSGGNKNRFFWEGEAKPLVEFPQEIEDLKSQLKETTKGLLGIDENYNGTGRVLKDYPLTTHGNWTEFKLSREDDVRQLHKDLMKAWTGR
jgi:hypothetical protein